MKDEETLDLTDGFGVDGGIGLDADLDLSAFDLDLGEAAPLDMRVANRYVLPKRYRAEKVNAVKYDRAVDFVRDFGAAILEGQTVHTLMSGNFIYGDIFEALAVEQNVFIDDLTLSTLSVSQNNVDSLRNLLAGDYLGSLNIIVSDYWWSHNRHNAPYIYEALDINDSFQLAVAGTHTKIALMRIGDKKIVVKGSANLRSSRSVEEATFETSDELYDFHMAWHRTILESYGTIKKAVRASALFDAILKNTRSTESWVQEYIPNSGLISRGAKQPPRLEARSVNPDGRKAPTG